MMNRLPWSKPNLDHKSLRGLHWHGAHIDEQLIHGHEMAVDEGLHHVLGGLGIGGEFLTRLFIDNGGAFHMEDGWLLCG